MPSIWKAANHTSYCPSVSCIIFDIDITSQKRNEHQSPFLFSFAKIPIKKLWVNSEDWMLPPQWKPVFIQQEDWFTYNEKHGTAADRSPPSGDTMFSGNGTSRGGFLPSCGIKKIPHMWYISWYLKKYHICGTKTSIVVSKDTTYVVYFADASKKGLFSDSPFFVFWVHQHDKNKCRNGHLSDLFWQHCYSSEWQWMGFLGGTCSP